MPGPVSRWGLFLPPETWHLGCTAVQFCSDVDGETRRNSHLLQNSHCHSLQSRSDICHWHPQPTAPWPVTARGENIPLLYVHEGVENQSWVSSARYHSDHTQGTSVCLLVLTVGLRWAQNPHFFLEPQSLNDWFLLRVALGGWDTLCSVAYCYSEILISINSVRRMLILQSDTESSQEDQGQISLSSEPSSAIWPSVIYHPCDSFVAVYLIFNLNINKYRNNITLPEFWGTRWE